MKNKKILGGIILSFSLSSLQPAGAEWSLGSFFSTPEQQKKTLAVAAGVIGIGAFYFWWKSSSKKKGDQPAQAQENQPHEDGGSDRTPVSDNKPTENSDPAQRAEQRQTSEQLPTDAQLPHPTQAPIVEQPAQSHQGDSKRDAERKKTAQQPHTQQQKHVLQEPAPPVANLEQQQQEIAMSAEPTTNCYDTRSTQPVTEKAEKIEPQPNQGASKGDAEKKEIAQEKGEKVKTPEELEADFKWLMEAMPKFPRPLQNIMQQYVVMNVEGNFIYIPLDFAKQKDGIHFIKALPTDDNTLFIQTARFDQGYYSHSQYRTPRYATSLRLYNITTQQCTKTYDCMNWLIWDIYDRNIALAENRTYPDNTDCALISLEESFSPQQRFYYGKSILGGIEYCGHLACAAGYQKDKIITELDLFASPEYHTPRPINWHYRGNNRITDVSTVDISDDSIAFFCNTDKDLFSWKINSKIPAKKLTTYPDDFNCLAAVATNDHNYQVISAHDDKKIRIWDCTTNTCKELPMPTERATCITAHAKEGKLTIYWGCKDGSVHAYEELIKTPAAASTQATAPSTDKGDSKTNGDNNEK